MKQSAATHKETSVMWWADSPPAPCRIVMKASSDISPGRLHYYQDWHQYQYLPLSFGTNYATGFTVYMDCTFSSITGIVTHGLSDCVFGEAVDFKGGHGEPRYCSGIPLHFAFSPGEHLTSVWLPLVECQPHASSCPTGMLSVGIFTLTLEKLVS
jgi:hypothetical protein